MFNADNLEKASAFAKQNPQVAEYLLQQATEILQKNKLLEQGKATIQSLEEIVRWSVNRYNNRSNPWAGEPMLAGHMNSSINMGEDAASKVDLVSVNFEFDLGENGTFRRGYSGDDIDSKPHQIPHLDNVVFAWMGSRGFVLVDNVLYKADPVNGANTGQVVTPEEFDAEISSETHGLASFLRQNNCDSEIVLINRSLEEEAKAVEKAPEEVAITAAETDYLAAKLAEQVDLRQQAAAKKAEEVAPQEPEGPAGPSGA